MIESRIANELTLKRYRRFKKNRLSVISIIFIISLTTLTFFAPLISNSKPIILNYKNKTYFPIFKNYDSKLFSDGFALVIDYKKLELSDGDWVIWPVNRWDPFESNDAVESYPSGPTSLNWFGTDDRGRDVFARLLYGFKYSIVFAITVWFFSYILGMIAGGVMGFFGGRVDFIGQRIVEVISTVPVFLLILIIILMFGASMSGLILISCAFGWIGISYYVRGEFLKNRQMEYVEAAKGIGLGKAKIIFKHILPNSLGPIITFSPFVISSNITALASLDYLGFGLPAPTPSWGELLNQAYKNFLIAWWLAVFPFLALVLTLMAFNLIGDGVRDAFDPRMKS